MCRIRAISDSSSKARAISGMVRTMSLLALSFISFRVADFSLLGPFARITKSADFCKLASNGKPGIMH
jgi:hypothetical protein